MFQGSVFLVVASDSFKNDDLDDIVSILEGNNAKVFIKEEYDNDMNYLSDEQMSLGAQIDHIICKSVQFIEYALAQKSMIPITTPEWVQDSVNRARISNPKVYNPDPKFFLKDTFVCVADNLPVGDKEAIYGGVRAFGGQYLDDLTRYTTHLIAMDMNNDKSVIAASAINTTQDNGEKIDIKIVLPNWIDDCLKHGKKLDEGPYLLPSPNTLNTQEPINSPIIHSNDELPTDFARSSFLDNKLFYICPDYKLSERLSSAIAELIKQHGGKVTTFFDPKLIDIYIGQYRAGDAFIASCKSNRIIVGNLQWLYSIIVSSKWTLPINSNLLHYPIPPKPLSEFQNVKISVTNYSGDARFYLSKLITILGGTFTKTLTRDNDFLVAAKPEGKKYEAANVKWKPENNIKIVNHLWLEECFADWKLIDYNKPQFQFLGDNSKGVESLLCKTKLKLSELEAWYNPKNLIIENENVADSMSEDESAQPRSNEIKDSNIQTPSLTHDTISEEKVNEEANDQTDNEDEEEEDAQGGFDEGRKKLPQLAKIEVEGKSKFDNAEILKHTSQLSAPESPITGRIGRSAKQKAVSKLHSDISDLNDYQKMSKSARKMKSYMEELDNNSPSKRKLESDIGEVEEAKKQVLNKQRKTEPKTEPSLRIVAIITGCENEISLTRHDMQQLNHIGIKVLSDYSTKQGINTLIAPRILRTAKFLRSLSQVDKIIHPNYLIDVLKKLNSSQDVSIEKISKEFLISDYSLDKVIPMKVINQELGVTDPKENGLTNLLDTDNRGLIFENMKINLSSNLVGGTQVISEILESHGLAEAKSVKSITASNVKNLLENANGKVIMVSNKAKDSKLINSFKKNVQDGVIVEWDWCVKSIFKMKLEEFDAYRL